MHFINNYIIFLGKEPIRTIAFVFDNILQSKIEEENPIHTEISIDNLESFYNYVKKNESSDIYSSILSNNKTAISIKTINSKLTIIIIFMLLYLRSI